MALLCRPTSPTSLQLRFGLRCRESPSVVLRVRFRPLDRRFGLVVAAGEAASDELKGGPWRASDGSPDSFAGWSVAKSGSGESPKQGSIGGMLRAALAGLLFAAGVTFATLSLTSKSALGAKREMEPLTMEQEKLINSNDTNGNVDHDLILPSEVNEDANKSRSDDVHHMEVALVHNAKSTDIGCDATERAIDQGDVKLVEDIDDISLPDVFNASTPELSAHVVDFSFDISNLEGLVNTTYSETQRSVTGDDVNMGRPHLPDDLIHLDTVSTNPIINHHDGNTKPAATSNSEVPLDLGSESQLNADLVKNLDTQVSIEDVVVNPAPAPGVQDFAQSGMQLPNQISTSDPSLCDINETDPSETSFNLEFDQSEGPMLRHDTISFLEGRRLNEMGSSVANSASIFADPSQKESDVVFDSHIDRNLFSSLQHVNGPPPHYGVPAPCHVSAIHQLPPGKVLVPALVDQVQGQALAALKVLKVVEADIQPGEVCSRREYARWLVTASNNLSRNTVSKIFPAMFIENVTELAFDDVAPDDPDFQHIQGLAEAGLLSSKLSRSDLGHSVSDQLDYVFFSPDSPVSRQDLISWKMASERRQLPQDLYKCSGYIDIEKINPDAWPALVADLSSGEQSITALAFGCTRLFQPDKPVTKAQTAIAIATGDAAEVFSEELARIAAESLVESAVNADSALIAQVEKDLNANFEEELAKEREKAKALEKLAEEAKLELDILRTEGEEEHNALINARAAVESEMEVLSRLWHEVEERLQSIMSNKLEISFERDRIDKLRKEAESQNQVIVQLQYELEVERKALSMARSWAEEEAKRVREQAKALEKAREQLEWYGTEAVDGNLQNDASAGSVSDLPSVDEKIQRGESLVKKLKMMASELRHRPSAVIEKIIENISSLVTALKQQALVASKHATKLGNHVISNAKVSVDAFQQNLSEKSSIVEDKARRIIEDCKENVEKITQQFKN